MNLYDGVFPYKYFNERIGNFDYQVNKFINENVSLNLAEKTNVVYSCKNT